MNIYHYDPQTGEFLGAGLADADPLVEDNFLIPANATDIPVPFFAQGQVAIFNNGDWQLVEDLRGEYYDASGNLHVIESINELPQQGWTKERPQAALFEDVRQALQLAINNKAREFGFSNGNALILYAGFTNAFQTLAQNFASWEVSVWVQAEAYKQQVIANTAPMLTPEQAVAMMPTYPA